MATSTRTNRALIREGRVEIRHGSVSHLPFSGDLFDLVTAVETHYFWPDLVSDLRETLRVLKPDGRMVLIAEAYRGGAHDERAQKWAELGHMTFCTADELRVAFDSAGYREIGVFEEQAKGWICVTGQKPRCSVS